MSVMRVILFMLVCEQGNCDWKNCKSLRAHVQVSLQMSLSPCSISKKLKPEIVCLPRGCEICKKDDFIVQSVDVCEKRFFTYKVCKEILYTNAYIYVLVSYKLLYFKDVHMPLFF